MNAIDKEIATLLEKWRTSAEEAVRVMHLLEAELLKTREKVALLESDLEIAKHALALASTNQRAPEARQ